MLPNLKKLEVWFLTGSQHLYGDDVLKQVAAHSREIISSINLSGQIPVKIIARQTLTTPELIYQVCLEANSSSGCIGVILWMHTFSPAKMWIRGLKILQKPLLHFHTQFNAEIPWEVIDMDFMNLNQSAHGDREFAHICARLNLKRKIIAGHWKDKSCLKQIGIWTRAAIARYDLDGARIGRLGDNMRYVAVTEGDKVEAEIKLGFSTNGYGISELAELITKITNARAEKLVYEYLDEYQVVRELKKGGPKYSSLVYAARIELGLRTFLKKENLVGFTDTFEDLHGLEQLPGIAVQRLMRDGYGFGAEGDWKTAALVRAMKVMSCGLEGGNSFMEDYTYNFTSVENQVLGAHMLEICESLAESKPSCEIHPLSIGGKSDPVRLVFNVGAGKAVNASLIDTGSRFRMLVNKVELRKPEKALPKLPVARAVWKPLPDLKTSATAWLMAGGSHHTCLSKALEVEHLMDFCEMMNIELLVIDESTNLVNFHNELRWNDKSVEEK